MLRINFKMTSTSTHEMYGWFTTTETPSDILWCNIEELLLVTTVFPEGAFKLSSKNKELFNAYKFIGGRSR